MSYTIERCSNIAILPQCCYNILCCMEYYNSFWNIFSIFISLNISLDIYYQLIESLYKQYFNSAFLSQIKLRRNCPLWTCHANKTYFAECTLAFNSRPLLNGRTTAVASSPAATKRRIRSARLYLRVAQYPDKRARPPLISVTSLDLARLVSADLGLGRGDPHNVQHPICNSAAGVSRPWLLSSESKQKIINEKMSRCQ